MKPIKLSEIHLNDGTRGLPKNPRFIRDEKFKKLCDSVRDNPEFMPARPIVVDENGTILGGNMRYRACKETGLKEVPADWVQRVTGWSDEKKRRFIILDNRGFGEDDMDMLANEWDMSELIAAGFTDFELTGDAKEDTPKKEKDEPEENDLAEKNPKLQEFIDRREASRERGKDKGEVNFWLCMVFQSHAQKMEFLGRFDGLETKYGMYVDGEVIAERIGHPLTPNNQKPIMVPVDKQLSGMVMP